MIGFSSFNLIMEEDAHVRHVASESDGSGGKIHHYEVNHPSLGSTFHVQVNTYEREPGHGEVETVEPHDGDIRGGWERHANALGPHVVRKAAKQIASHLGVHTLGGVRITGSRAESRHGFGKYGEVRFRT